MQVRKPFIEIFNERHGFTISDEYRAMFKSLMSATYGNNSVGSTQIFEELIIEWENFVNELKEDGYDLCKQEFENDLDTVQSSIIVLQSSKCVLEDHSKVLDILKIIDLKFEKIELTWD
jgi:hypothetical protein